MDATEFKLLTVWTKWLGDLTTYSIRICCVNVHYSQSDGLSLINCDFQISVDKGRSSAVPCDIHSHFGESSLGIVRLSVGFNTNLEGKKNA